MSKLVHVNRIEMVSVDSLASMRIVSDTSCRVPVGITFTEICINELVGVTIDDDIENNQKIFTTTAVFATSNKKPLTDRRLAFRLTSVDGKKYMIGTYGRPFPIIKERNQFPEKPADSSLKTVTVTWKATLPMLRIIE